MPQRHIKRKTLESMYLLIEQRGKNMLRRAVDSDPCKYGIPLVHKRLKPFFLGSFSKAITGKSHELSHFERCVTRDMGTEVFIQHPKDLPTDESLG